MCGKNNCRRYYGSAEKKADCCTKPQPVISIPSLFNPIPPKPVWKPPQIQDFNPWGIRSGDDIVQPVKQEAVIRWTGQWGSFAAFPHHCPEGTFVFAYKLRSERKQGGSNITALTSIILYCRKPNTVSWIRRISSAEGFGGTWGSLASCHGYNNPVVGFYVREEEKQGSG